MKYVFILVSSVLSAGCATTFSGSAKIDGGPRKCENICKNWGMDLTGMVALGDYTDGCICTVPGRQLSSSDVNTAVAGAAGSTGGGAAGVMMQMESNEAKSHPK